MPRNHQADFSYTSDYSIPVTTIRSHDASSYLCNTRIFWHLPRRCPPPFPLLFPVCSVRPIFSYSSKLTFCFFFTPHPRYVYYVCSCAIVMTLAILTLSYALMRRLSMESGTILFIGFWIGIANVFECWLFVTRSGGSRCFISCTDPVHPLLYYYHLLYLALLQCLLLYWTVIAHQSYGHHFLVTGWSILLTDSSAISPVSNNLALWIFPSARSVQLNFIHSYAHLMYAFCLPGSDLKINHPRMYHHVFVLAIFWWLLPIFTQRYALVANLMIFIMLMMPIRIASPVSTFYRAVCLITRTPSSPCWLVHSAPAQFPNISLN